MAGVLAPMTVPEESRSAPPFDPAHHTTGFFDDHPSRREVPWVQEKLPEGVEPSLGQIAKIDGGRPTAADAAGAAEYADELGGVFLEEVFPS